MNTISYNYPLEHDNDVRRQMLIQGKKMERKEEGRLGITHKLNL